MAKSRRKTYEPLPLSDAFYALISHTAARAGLSDPGDEALALAVSALSEVYTRGRGELADVATQHGARLARVHFFLPRDLVKAFGPLDELARAGRVPEGKTLRVLDLGAGLGATTLGLARWLRLRARSTERLSVTAYERDERALAVFRALAENARDLPHELVPIDLDARNDDITRVPQGERYDVILLGFVLNELFSKETESRAATARAELLAVWARALRPGGVIIVLEPALKQVTRALMRVRDELAGRAGGPHVLAPCLRAGPCPMLANERDWCHEELAYALPPRLAGVARRAGLRFEGLSYAALVLGDEPRGAITTAEGERLYRIVSDRLETKGKLELYGCGEDGYVRFTRLERDESRENGAFGEAARGGVIGLRDADGGRVQKQSLVRRV